MKTKEEKLQEAAEKILFHNSDFTESKPEKYNKKTVIDSMIEFLKSEAAKYYHQPEPVNVEKLRDVFCRKFHNGDFDLSISREIFDFFLPHLQNNGGDAVEFARWILNNWSFNDNEKLPNITEQLYAEFKNQK